MKILLAGQKRFGRDVLAMIIRNGYSVAAVCCPVNESDKLFAETKKENLPVIPAGSLTADAVPPGVDLIVTAHSHDFIGRRTREKTRLGALGYHPSLLPLHRGRDAIRWTIKMREPVAGGSVYWLSESVDAGAIAAQDWCFVRPADTPLELWARALAPIGVRLLEKVLRDIAAGKIIREPQDESLASWEPSFQGAPRLRRPD